MERLSPAKVNLSLRVLRRREDGYHDIASLMQQISLCDEMTFQSRERGIVLQCPASGLPEDRGNIVYRAAEAFFARLPQPGGVEITLRKRIPQAAGLGGGSSNAATTLMALNEMAATPLRQEELLKIGASLGADVPFFLFGRSAWAFGIGDRLRPAENLPLLWLVLINPRFAVPTKMVYEKLNLRLTNEMIHYSIPRFLTIPDVAEGLENDLERVTLKLYPELQQLKDLLLGQGARGALMSGSGPTVFGIFEEEAQASAAGEAVARMGQWDVFTACSLQQ